MKKKLLFFAIAMSIAGYVLAACGPKACGGGSAGCCTEGSATYYMTARPPQ